MATNDMDALRIPTILAMSWLVAWSLAKPPLCWAGQLDAVRAAVREEDRDADQAGDAALDESESKRNRRVPGGSGRSRRRPGRSAHVNMVFVDGCSPAPYFPGSYATGYITPRVPVDGYEVVQGGPIDTPPLPMPEAEYWYARFPYADGSCGYLVFPDEAPTAQPWSCRIGFDVGRAGEKIQRRGFTAMLEGASHWGIDIDWNSFSERDARQRHDELHLGTVNLLHRLAMTEQVVWRAGVGANWMGDAAAIDWGLNLTLRLDIYPVRPLVISSQLDWGTQGDAEMFHGEITCGAMWNRAEIFSGYDYRRIGDVELSGPRIGLRLWF